MADEHPTAGRAWADPLTVIGLMGALWSIYLFTYSGLVNTTDELFLLDTTESLARHASILRSETGDLDWPGEAYVEPGQPVFAAPLFWAADRLGWVGNVHAVLLFNPLVTALTAGLVFHYLRRGGHSSALAAFSALTFGLATIAWPYTRNFFREPLSTLTLFGTAYLLLRWRQALAAEERGHLRWLAGAGLAGAASILSKESGLIGLPVLAAVYFPWRQLPRRRAQEILSVLGVVLAAVALVLAGYWLYTSVLRAGAGRFDPIGRWNGMLANLGLPAAWVGMAGLVVSPGKSLFAYSPVLLLSVGPLAMSRIERSRTHLWPLALLAVFVPVYAFVRGEIWWGGTGWGPRYMVPLTPFLIVAAAPSFEHILLGRSRWARVGLFGLIAVSLLVQIAGVTVSIADYYETLARANVGTAWDVGIWSPYFSAIPTHLRLIGVKPPDFAWVLARADGPDWLLAGAMGLTLAAFIALMVVGLRLPGHSPTRRRARALAGAGLLGAIGLTGLFLWRIYPDGRFRGDNAALHQMRQWMERTDLPDPIWVLNNNTYFWFVMNYYKGDALVYTLPLSLDVKPWGAPGPDPSTDPRTLAEVDAISIVEYFPTFHRTAGLIMERGPFHLDAVRPVEWWMDEHFYSLGVQEFAPDVRLALFSTARPPERLTAPAYPLGAVLGDALELTGYDVSPMPGAPLRPGDILDLSVQWRALAQPERAYTVGTYLINSEGMLAAQRDAAPVGGFWPQDTWTPGTVVRDNVALRLPRDLPPGRYEVWTLLYSLLDGQRLPVSAGGAVGDDHVVLFTLEVVP